MKKFAILSTVLLGSFCVQASRAEPQEASNPSGVASVPETDTRAVEQEEPAADRFVPTVLAWHDGGSIELKHTAEAYDSLLARWYERSVAATFDNFFREFIELDSLDQYISDVPDSVYSARLASIPSPINIGYNDVVRQYIIAYSEKRKALMGRIIGLAHFYFPMIEEELEKAGLPLELRMLPVIESALNPVAVSRMGATGLWQFMLRTGKSYGLEITSFVDERRDPVLATRAACGFLGDLYKMYGDWTLAIAAYNCGPGNVNKALKRAGEGASTFWDIYPYLPRETRGYIPSFAAATYAFNFHWAHGIEPVAPPIPLATDTIMIDKLMHFEQIASTIGTPIETLRSLNPQYKSDIIPAIEKQYPLNLPQEDVTRYIAYEPEIIAKDSVYLAQYLKRDPKTNIAQFTVSAGQTYKVKSGDTLGAIAKKHGCTVSQLMNWNNLKSAHKLSIGQVLEIRK